MYKIVVVPNKSTMHVDFNKFPITQSTRLDGRGRDNWESFLSAPLAYRWQSIYLNPRSVPRFKI